MKKTSSILDLGEIKISDIVSKVKQIPDSVWMAETKWRQNDFDCFHSTEHIVFIFSKGPLHRDFFVKPNWALWQSTLQPLIDSAVAPYGYESGVIVKAMLARLKAGGKIDRHIDAAPRNPHLHKIHIPIVTSPEVIMDIGDASYHLEAGKAYEVNNIVPHGVKNNSDQDRIHFIFEYYDADAK